jgi:putative acetyltransferase
MNEHTLTIAPEAPDQPDVVAMLQASDAYMDGLYPAENNYLLDVRELMVPAITFLVARRDGQALGCAALARREDYAEIKRMWVAPAARGLKLGRRLLDALETLARNEAIPVLMLEAGDEQPEAMGLYNAAGFEICPAFGDYPEGPPSVFMEKRLG